MYKLITLDLDGTLLDSEGNISEKNKNAILKAINNGIEVVLASGRVINSIKTIANELGTNNYLIAGNGAIVYDIQNNKTIYSNCLSLENVLKIIKKCEENNIFYSIATKDSIITENLNYNVLFYSSENFKKSLDKRINIEIVESVKKYIKKYLDNDFLKITICDSEEDRVLNILKEVQKIEDIDALEVTKSSKKNIKIGRKEEQIEYYYTDISNKDVNKWSAIKFLAQKLNIKDEEIMSIGDNLNDLEMIKNAGMGIAMENGVVSVKEEANIVTKSNDNNGIAHAINRYIK